MKNKVTVEVKNLINSKVLADQCVVGNTLFGRMKGLLGKRGLGNGEGIWLTPCNSIHTFFMKFSIDVVYVDKKFQVVSLFSNVEPWSFHFPKWRAASVFEFPAGVIEKNGLSVGDKLCISLPSSPEESAAPPLMSTTK